ncbi:MAG TPA: hypothetical protein VHP38_14555, partial [Ruminiclostridium sp.]|nr:hypothetical protein [Ruminiclostridium sp.]
VMRQKKCCKNCERGLSLHLTKDILCKFHGVVTPDYVCFRFKEGTALPASKEVKFKCVHCENFIVNLDSPNEHVGRCKLFSERNFDGTLRNACSKFNKKFLIDVS